MPKAKLPLIASENRGGFPKPEADAEAKAFSSSLDNGMRAPALVARLVGLVSMPAVQEEKPRRALDSKFCYDGDRSSMSSSSSSSSAVQLIATFLFMLFTLPKFASPKKFTPRFAIGYDKILYGSPPLADKYDIVFYGSTPTPHIAYEYEKKCYGSSDDLKAHRNFLKSYSFFYRSRRQFLSDRRSRFAEAVRPWILYPKDDAEPSYILSKEDEVGLGMCREISDEQEWRNIGELCRKIADEVWINRKTGATGTPYLCDIFGDYYLTLQS